MIDPMQKYRNALAAFAVPGNRYSEKGALTYWGKAAGLSADEIIHDARAHGVKDRDADIRRGWGDARPQGARPATERKRRTVRTPPTFPRYVRDMIGDMATAQPVTLDAVRRLSPFSIPLSPQAQTEAFMRALFEPGDLLHVFRSASPSRGVPGENLLPCREWMERIGRGETLPGDLIIPNPFTGKPGETANGTPSYIAQSCLAAFPFIVVEFDEMPLAVQCAFWRGLLEKSPLAGIVAAIVFSGGKSLHGLLYVKSTLVTEWQAMRDRVRGLLSSDADPCFRADPQAMRPRTGTRIPGAIRSTNGNRQQLIYLNPAAVRMDAKEKAATWPRVMNMGKCPSRCSGRAPGAEFHAVAHCAPLPPVKIAETASFDDLLTAHEVAETWKARP